MIPQSTIVEGDFLSSSNKTSSFGLEVSPEAFAILSSQIYQYKIAAVVREYSCNACDGHSAAGSSSPFTIRLPSVIDPFFVVIDNGIGLDDHGVRNVFASYFKSTKKNTNNETGFLGLGAKSGYSYADSFTIEARKDGIERIYVAYFDATRVPALDMLSERKTSQPNGVTIKVPVQESDFMTFKRDAEFIASFTTITPNIEGGELWDSEIKDKLDNDGWALSSQGIPYSTSSLYRLSSTDVGVVMGGVVYPVQRSTVLSLLKDEECDDRDNVYMQFFHNLQKTLFIQVGMGDVEFAASRETLSLTPRTKEAVSSHLKNVIDGVLKEVRDNIPKFESPVKAAKYARDVLGYTPNLVWRGNTTLNIINKSVGTLFNLFKSTILSKESSQKVRQHQWTGTTLRELYGRVKIIHNDTKRAGLVKYSREHIITDGRYHTRYIRMSKKLRPSQIERFKKILGLTDEDFIKSSDLIPARATKKQKSAADETLIRCCRYNIQTGHYHSTDVVDASSLGNVVYVQRDGGNTTGIRLPLWGGFPLFDPEFRTSEIILRDDVGIDNIIYMNKSNESKIKKLGILPMSVILLEFFSHYKDHAIKLKAQEIVNECSQGLRMGKYVLLSDAKSNHMHLTIPRLIVSGYTNAKSSTKDLTDYVCDIMIKSPDIIDEARKLAVPLVDDMKKFASEVDNTVMDMYPLLSGMVIGSEGTALRRHQIEYIQLIDNKKGLE